MGKEREQHACDVCGTPCNGPYCGNSKCRETFEGWLDAAENASKGRH